MEGILNALKAIKIFLNVYCGPKMNRIKDVETNAATAIHSPSILVQ